MQEIYGSTEDLKPYQRKRLQQLFRRTINGKQLVSPELAEHLAEISFDLKRQVGVLVERNGKIAWVVLGDAQRIYLPDIGRNRGAITRFRGLRYIHTHLQNEPLKEDDFTDLVLLRFDAVIAINVSAIGKPDTCHWAYLSHDGKEELPYQVIHVRSVYDFTGQELDIIRDAEKSFSETFRESQTDRALLIFVTTSGQKANRELRQQKDELKELCKTAGIQVIDIFIQRRPHPDPKYVVGKGKIEEIALKALDNNIDLLIFNNNLAPNQMRSIAKETDLRIIDRTMLILDIFAKHAKSSEGKLQVELAQMRYTLPRLVEKDTAMSRLSGGIGLRGPGETKLEMNRRRARERIQSLEQQIEKLANQRNLKRKKRDDSFIPVISLIGYTNAGKSTLLNALTQSDVETADKLFSTLDTTIRRIRFPQEREVIIADTVGFIRDLPADLIAAFRATLEELAHSNLLIHLVDVSDENYDDKIQSVVNILQQLDLMEIPSILVFNKNDLVNYAVLQTRTQKFQAISISASHKNGLDNLLDHIERRLWHNEKGKQWIGDIKP